IATSCSRESAMNWLRPVAGFVSHPVIAGAAASGAAANRLRRRRRCGMGSSEVRSETGGTGARRSGSAPSSLRSEVTHPPSARPTEPPQSTPPDRGAETPASGAVWTDADLAASPHARADKADRVRRMFAAIAGSYDLNNRVHSLGLDQAWRRRAVRAAGVRPGETVLDVACGTGDLTETFA